jgi:O-antigen/teichoic acid export membrane protein
MGIGPVQRQSLIGFTSTIGLTAVGFLSTMYFAHAAGPAVLGVYFLFLAIFGIFDLIGDGGFGGAVIKRISEGTDQSAFFSAFVILRILLLVVSVSILLIIGPYLDKLTNTGLIPLLILALAVSVFTSGISYTVYGTGKVGIIQIGGLFNNLARIAVQVGAIFLGFGAAGLAGGFIVGLIVAGLFNLRFLDLGLGRFTSEHIRSLFTFSIWTFLSSSGLLVFTYSDTVILGFFMTEADIGIYRVALQLTTIATFTTVALHATLFPRMSSWSAQGDLSAVETALARAFTYSLLLALPVLLGGWLLGERLLYFFYSASFAAGAPALAVLLLVQVAYVFMFLQTMTLNALDRPRDSFRVTATAAVVNILLNLLLIPVLGIVGAAIATLGSMALNAGLSYIVLRRHMHVGVERKPLINIVFATLIMGGMVVAYAWLLPLTNVIVVLGAVAMGGLFYLIALLKLDSGIHDELKDLTQKLGLPWPARL